MTAVSQPDFHILLLRHGQTDANATGVLQGHQPTPLNELGVRQARLLGTRLVGYSPRIEAIVSSDLPRAVQTAEPIASACGVPLLTDRAWRERGFGEFEGKPVGERHTWHAVAGGIDPPGAEPYDTFQLRIRDALLALPGRFAGKSAVAVVTHGGPCRAVLRMLSDGQLALADAQLPPPLVPIVNCSIMHLVVRTD